ncbi:MAG: hypothetical protein VSS75_031370 [Candidatus Parabeggiatoa sp.]|nr:hypothetical protein [Candidatus Parabeggiatoa sp.]
MKLSNPLPETWRAIIIAEDAFKITRKVIVRSPKHPNEACQSALQTFQSGLLKGTVYEGNNALRLLEDERSKPSLELREIKALFILELWANFERFLRSYLQEKGLALKQHVHPPILADALYEHFQTNVERWEPRDILDFLKKSLFSTEPVLQQLIEEAKSIYTYRNWVAHANPKKRNSGHELKTTFKTLNDIIEILLQT